MNFAEVRFWEYLLVGLGAIFLFRPLAVRLSPRSSTTFDKWSMLLLSLWLLAWTSLLTCLIFLLVGVVTYWGLRWVVRSQMHRASFYFAILIPLQLAPLFYYKYADFAVNRVLGGDFDLLRGLIIPAGISFYTFQLVSFVIDTLLLKLPMPTFIDTMNYAGFFPQIVAGPIERRADLLPQMEQFRFRWLPAKINDGAAWIVIGFFYKACLADNLAQYFNGSNTSNAYVVWLDNLIFGLRIYCDFAGYSLIAFGVGKLFGIELTLNFLSPYCASSISEFWRRWHVTLSQWFRDYLYFPLGGGRTRWWAANILIVFVVSGIWHGAGWNFIFWGFFHALFLIGQRLLAGFRCPKFIGWAITIFLVFFSWLSFYEVDTSKLLLKFRALAAPASYSIEHLKAAVQSLGTGHLFACGAFIGLAFLAWSCEWFSLRKNGQPYSFYRNPVVLVLLVVVTILLGSSENNGFIYFAF